MLTAYKVQKKTKQIEKIEQKLIKEALGDFSSFLWVDVLCPAGVWPNSEEMAILKGIFKLHFLVLEDCVTPKHYPKAEEHKGYNFFIISKIHEREDKELESKKICIVVGRDFIITYRHSELKEIDAAKKSIISLQEGVIEPIDIFHAISDKVIDDYVFVIDSYTEKIDEIEDQVFEEIKSFEILQSINIIRKNLIIIRKNALLQKEIFYTIVSGGIKLTYPEKIIYFKDIYDHLERVLGKLETQKEYLTDLLNVQIGLSGQKLNKLVKFLTVISAVLLPSTLIASVFGMNFEKMPLTDISSGFTVILSIMFALGFLTFLFLFRKKWL